MKIEKILKKNKKNKKKTHVKFVGVNVVLIPDELLEDFNPAHARALQESFEGGVFFPHGG